MRTSSVQELLICKAGTALLGITLLAAAPAFAAGVTFSEDEVCVALFGGAPCAPEVSGRAFGAELMLAVGEDVSQPSGSSPTASGYYVDARAASVTVAPHGQASMDKSPFTVLRLTYGLALEDRGHEAVLAKVGVEPSGDTPSTRSASLRERAATSTCTSCGRRAPRA